MRWHDRVIGVVLGLILGVGIVTGFVFIYSEETIDAPSISEEGGDGQARGGGQGSDPAPARGDGEGGRRAPAGERPSRAPLPQG